MEQIRNARNPDPATNGMIFNKRFQPPLTIAPVVNQTSENNRVYQANWACPLNHWPENASASHRTAFGLLTITFDSFIGDAIWLAANTTHGIQDAACIIVKKLPRPMKYPLRLYAIPQII